MSYKDIIVVDDVGDAFEALEKLCEDDLELNVIHAKSDENSLKKSFKRNSYLILINEEGLNIDLSLLIYFIKNNLYMLSIPIMIITGNEDSFKNQPVMEPPVINYIKRPIDNEDFKERLDISLEILEYYKNINDISGLPGSEIFVTLFKSICGG